MFSFVLLLECDEAACTSVSVAADLPVGYFLHVAMLLCFF